MNASAERQAALIAAMPVVFVLIWSTGFIVARYGMPHAGPMTFLAWRYTFSIAAFGLWIALARAPWPRADPAWLVEDSFALVVQVNGKLRATVDAPKRAAREQPERLARDAAAAHLAGKTERRVIVVPDRLVNFVLA